MFITRNYYTPKVKSLVEGERGYWSCLFPLAS